MTFVLCQLSDQDGSLALVAIADTSAREAWVLPSAGADPVPMTDFERALVAERGLTTPEDLVAVMSQNMLISAGPTSEHDTFEEALAAGDAVLYQAQGGREPRTDIPGDVASALLELEMREQELHDQIRWTLLQHRRQVEELQNLLTKPIELPDRYSGSASDVDEHAEATLLARFDELDKQLLADLGQEVDEPKAGGPRRTTVVEGSDAVTLKSRLASLGLPTRIRNLLDEAGIHTVGQLAKRTEAGLRRIDGLGDKSVDEIRESLDRCGFTLKAPTKPPSRRAAKAQLPAGFRRGRIKNFLPRGFGFIVPAGGGDDLFFHATALRNLLPSEELSGTEVIFRLGSGPDGRSRADEVRPWPG